MPRRRLTPRDAADQLPVLTRMLENPSAYLNRKIRFAVVGCGRISKNHFEALNKHTERTRLVAVGDTDNPALDAAMSQTGAAGFSNLTTLLRDSDADVVVLATPSGLHAAQTIEIAKAGRHVITEKPMATRWEAGRRMVRACDEAAVRLFVVKQY